MIAVFTKYYWCFIMVGVFINVSFGVEKNWELKKNSDNLLIYTRETSFSSIREIKCVTNFNATLNSLVAFIYDIPAHPQYIYRCKSAKILKVVNEYELYYYHETETPWPVQNRYGVIYYKIKQDPITKVVVIESHEVLGMTPKQEDKVEVEKLTASWVFTPKGNGLVEGVYYLYLNPGGSVPSWLINLFATEGPYQTILKMKTLLPQSKYKNAKIGNIVN